MSFADGLLHERQEKDDKTRQRVMALITKLKRPVLQETDVNKAIMYLEKYAKGDQLI